MSPYSHIPSGKAVEVTYNVPVYGISESTWAVAK